MKEKPIMAQRIRELRKSANLTQSELAEKIGLREAAIRSYENGLREPNSKAMVALERYFKVSGEYLRGESDNRDVEYSWEDEEVRNEVRSGFTQLMGNVLKEVQSCSEEEQKYIFNILVELRHILANNNKTLVLSLAQDILAISIRFIDTSNNKSLVQEKIKDLKNETVEMYSTLLDDVMNEK